MAKFPRIPKLSKEKTQELLTDFCEAIAMTKSSTEAAELLTDLLGKQELEMISKRLRIAELLMENNNYTKIQDELKTSPSTIARVQVWLQNAGEGYRKIIERTKSARKIRDKNEQPLRLRGIKKKYPIYFWPQIMLESWVKNSTQKQRTEMQKILSKVTSKTEVYKELELLLSMPKAKK
jgi:TrpR-related protein YerC/YecD